MKDFNRRSFLKISGLSALPALLTTQESIAHGSDCTPLTEVPKVFFINEGPFYTAAEFITKLQQINKAGNIERDFYGQGGMVSQLTQKLATLTNKEAAIYLPTGTLANQLAISVLSDTNSKVFVQETSHVYRDEADAAQTLFNKRLIPLAKGEPFFSVEDLDQSILYHTKEEVFKSGIGAVSIEVPVRRCDNKIFPIDEIRKVSAYCRKNGIKLHLDGARLHIASAYTGISVTEYASYFDTVYLCLYKYLGAAGGAVLCGDKTLIGKMDHLIKIHGGSIFTNWPNAAIALHNLDGIDDRLQKVVIKSKELLGLLNQLPEIKIEAIENGTNIYNLKLSVNIDGKKLKETLKDKHAVILGALGEDGIIKMKINETLLYRENNDIFNAFKDALMVAKK